MAIHLKTGIKTRMRPWTLSLGEVAFLIVTCGVVGSCLFATSSLVAKDSHLGAAISDITKIIFLPKAQWVFYSSFCVYFVVLVICEHRLNGSISNAYFRLIWICLCLLIATASYIFHYSESVFPANAIIFAFGILVGRLVGTWTAYIGRHGTNVAHLSIVGLLIVMLVIASLQENISPNAKFFYVGERRWSGPWTNPNTFGMMMGAGLVLITGMLIAIRGIEPRKMRFVIMMLCIAALFFIGRALLLSYSRGGLMATACGLVYLMCFFPKRKPLSVTATFRIGCAILAVTAVISLSFLRNDWTVSKNLSVRRAFSLGNINDFSWRNRVAAWEGASQMTLEKPLVGFGWNQPELFYNNLYSLPRIIESVTIHLNDYLMLGASIGIPALACFIIYIVLSLRPESAVLFVQCKPISFFETSSVWLGATCRAAAVVLIVGFWFDGGLFNLPTASAFWILLELGRSVRRESA